MEWGDEQNATGATIREFNSVFRSKAQLTRFIACVIIPREKSMITIYYSTEAEKENFFLISFYVSCIKFNNGVCRLSAYVKNYTIFFI